jgi:RHS repeat-associated protein
MSRVNPFRFSTKYQDDETDLLYYGYRYYSASMGRWFSRDPIGERGGINLYGYCGNDPADNVDTIGLDFGIWIGHPGYNFQSPGRPPRLFTDEDVYRITRALDAEVRKTRCCCTRARNTDTGLDVKITGSANGVTITEYASVRPLGPCIEEDSYQYYWWDCSSAARDYANASSPPDLDWHDYGWIKGDPSHVLSRRGISTRWHDRWPYPDLWDYGRWNTAAAVIFIYCGKDGHRHAGRAKSDYVEWEWSTDQNSWSNPHSGYGSP